MRAAERLTERVGRERTDKLKKVKRICLFGEEINVERSEARLREFVLQCCVHEGERFKLVECGEARLREFML